MRHLGAIVQYSEETSKAADLYSKILITIDTLQIVSSSDQPSVEQNNEPRVFNTTHWSVVLSAQNSNPTQAEAALELLCRTYWYPLYAYLRRSGYGEHDAQDLTQGFFAHLLQRRAINTVARERGKFRSFLLACMKFYVANQRDRASALKRGGGHKILSLDAEDAEERYRLEPPDNRTPEKLFEYKWAITLLNQVLVTLEQEFNNSGKSAVFPSN
jgi:DNA-directed RNA polymerase specialized sigma24 family protein